MLQTFTSDISGFKILVYLELVLGLEQELAQTEARLQVQEQARVQVQVLAPALERALVQGQALVQVQAQVPALVLAPEQAPVPGRLRSWARGQVLALSCAVATSGDTAGSTRFFHSLSASMLLQQCNSSNEDGLD